MLLIRPLLRANAWRRTQVHVVIFFIFLVANIGGTLTPLGDPPLFLGFLHGVPFFWVTEGLLPHMLTAAALVLAIFFAGRHAAPTAARPPAPRGRAGRAAACASRALHNLVFLLGVMGG